MRNTLILFVSIFIIGCKTTSFQPPCEDLLKEGNRALYFPIDEGNKWTYVVKSFDDKDRGVTYTLELCGTDTINYKRNGKKYSIEALRVCMNDDSSQFSYFAKCGEGAYLLQVNNWYHKELKDGWLIPNSPEEGERVSTETEMIWRGQEVVNTPRGEYQTWVLEELRELGRREMKLHREHRVDDTKTVKTRYYFAEGVGLVKTEIYGAPGELIALMELTDYKVKSKKGGKVR